MAQLLPEATAGWKAAQDYWTRKRNAQGDCEVAEWRRCCSHRIGPLRVKS